MPQVKQYTAKRQITLDCGHTVKEGEAFQVTSVFTCAKEATWPLRILMGCFQAIRQKQAAQLSDAAAKPKAQAG
jgi:hypothetical protein